MLINNTVFESIINKNIYENIFNSFPGAVMLPQTNYTLIYELDESVVFNISFKLNLTENESIVKVSILTKNETTDSYDRKELVN